MKRLAALAFAALFAVSAKAQTPAAELANPPADARHFIILSTGGKHGDSWAWTLPDGMRMSRESLNLRGRSGRSTRDHARRRRHASQSCGARRHPAGRCRGDFNDRRWAGNVAKPGR